MNWRTRIAATILAACSIAAGTSLAQEPVDEVVVKGIRGSLASAMDVKRNSTGVVDAISAEDINRFPDTNLAESLQRITGVSINRVQGEGSEVTVRGFAGQYNLVTLNGRQMPAANIQTLTSLGDVGDSRSFDFSNLAAEGVSGLQIYKTGRASAPSGGIGATINIETSRPLAAGTQFSVGARAVDDAGGDKITPELSGLASWSNDDRTVGISAFASYQERNFSNRSIGPGTLVWGPYDPENSAFANAVHVNEPEPGQLAGFPQSVNVAYGETTRERVNGMLTAQIAPTDKLTITADATYISNELDSISHLPGIWWNRAFSYIEWDDNPVVSIPTLMVEPVDTFSGKDVYFHIFERDTVDETTAFGLNLDYQATDSLSFNADFHSASAESSGNGPLGQNFWRGSIAGAVGGWQAADFSGKTPKVSIDIRDGLTNGNGIFELEDLGSQVVDRGLSEQVHDLDQIQLGGLWDAADGLSVNFGVGYIQSSMNQRNEFTRDNLGGFGVANPGDLPPGLAREIDIVGKFNDVRFGLAEGVPPEFIQPGANLVGIASPAFTNVPFEFQQGMVGNPLYPNWDFNNPTSSGLTDNRIDEDTVLAFLEARMEGQIGDMSTQTVLGLRWEQTDVRSATDQLVLQTFVWESDNDFGQIVGNDVETVTETHSYDYLLPNLDFSIDLSDNLKARASLSKTIARPQYGAMFVTTDVSSPETLTFLGGIPTAAKGTAALDPLESNNFDLSIEYYYNESSYASIGYFQKAVNNFVGTEQVSQPLFGLRDPTSGRPGTRSGDAIAALEAGGFAVNETNIFTMTAILDNPQDFPNGAAEFDPSTAFSVEVFAAYDVIPDNTDPLLSFQTQQPVNNETANIDGIELSWQHFFGDSGFGFMANATLVDGDISFDNAGAPDIDQFALEGLSDSANLVLIYENDVVGARVAYNWRDEFLSNTNRSRRLPEYNDEYQQLDLNLTWYVNDQLNVSLDGINLTEEEQILFGRTRRNIWSVAEGDARWVLSARYAFR